MSRENEEYLIVNKDGSALLHGGIWDGNDSSELRVFDSVRSACIVAEAIYIYWNQPCKVIRRSDGEVVEIYEDILPR